MQRVCVADLPPSLPKRLDRFSSEHAEAMSRRRERSEAHPSELVSESKGNRGRDWVLLDSPRTSAESRRVRCASCNSELVEGKRFCHAGQLPALRFAARVAGEGRRAHALVPSAGRQAAHGRPQVHRCATARPRGPGRSCPASAARSACRLRAPARRGEGRAGGGGSARRTSR